MLVDREEEMSLLKKLLKGELPYQIVNICEKGGKGKSCLVQAFKQQCRESRIPCCILEFAADRPTSPVDCMRDLVDVFGEHHFPKFTREDIEIHRDRPLIQIGGGESSSEVSISGDLRDAEIQLIAGRDNISIENIRVANQEFSQNRLLYIERILTKIFIQELQVLSQSTLLVIIFDAVEHVPTSTSNWLWKHLLLPAREGERSNLLLIFSGRPEGSRPGFLPVHDWSHVLYEITAFGDFKKEHVLEYFHRKLNLPIKESEIEAYYRVCKNNPLIMGQIGDILYSEKWTHQ